MVKSAVLLFLAASLTLPGCAGLRPLRSQTQTAELWLTVADGSARMENRPLIAAPAATDAAIEIDPGRQFQSMVGFGAAITDSSAHLIRASLSEDERKALMTDLFGPTPGANFAFTRIVIGASDFSSDHYSYDEPPDGGDDPELAHFSIDRARSELLPTLTEARSINNDLKIMASPWSAPAWMKTTGSLVAGTLRDDAALPFARYLVRTIEAFRAEGVPIGYLSIQNEPDFEPADYPGMRLSADQRAHLIGQYVGPELERAGLGVKLLEWDHNWNSPQQPLTVLADKDAAQYISGVAWHCYGGDVAAQSMVRAQYPDKDVFFTECSGGRWSAPWPDAFIWTMRNIIIGAAENWSRGAIMWNLALDENDGPHLGGCGNCRGVVTIDSKTGEVTRNPEYYALAHASRFVRSGALRIASTCAHEALDCVAFLNNDGSRVLIALNASKEKLTVRASEGGREFAFELPAEAAATLVWN